MKRIKMPDRLKIIPFVIALTLLFTPCLGISGVTPLVTTQWLEDHLGASDMVIVDVRTKANYGFGHIPGAVNLPYTDWEPACETGCLLMPSAQQLTEKFQKMGVDKGSHVIVYGHGNTGSDVTKAAAAYWITQAMGHTKVSLLNGGFTKWTFEGRIIDNKVPSPAPGNFVAARDGSRIAAFGDVRKAVNTRRAILVDARTSAQHFGHIKRADVECYGHIPQSVSLPADFLTNAGINRSPATIKSKEELARIVKGAGIPADRNKELIVYCNTAQLAGLDYLVLRDILGYRNVRVYDGSMLEYCQIKGDMPVERFAWGHVTYCADCD